MKNYTINSRPEKFPWYTLVILIFAVIGVFAGATMIISTLIGEWIEYDTLFGGLMIAGSSATGLRHFLNNEVVARYDENQFLELRNLQFALLSPLTFDSIAHVERRSPTAIHFSLKAPVKLDCPTSDQETTEKSDITLHGNERQLDELGNILEQKNLTIVVSPYGGFDSRKGMAVLGIIAVFVFGSVALIGYLSRN